MSFLSRNTVVECWWVALFTRNFQELLSSDENNDKMQSTFTTYGCIVINNNNMLVLMEIKETKRDRKRHPGTKLMHD